LLRDEKGELVHPPERVIELRQRVSTCDIHTGETCEDDATKKADQSPEFKGKKGLYRNKTIRERRGGLRVFILSAALSVLLSLTALN